MPGNGAAATIEVFADVWCPFAHFGLHALSRELRRCGPHAPVVWVRAWPLEWVNGEPLAPGRVLEHAMELRGQVAGHLFEKVDVTAFPRTTIPALALVAAAYRRAPDLGTAASHSVRDALFERGEDVASPAVLHRLADELGLEGPGPDDYAAVAADWKEGRRRGVAGSPHFFCGTTDNAFCPSLDITAPARGEGAVIRANLPRLAAFFARCVAGPDRSATGQP